MSFVPTFALILSLLAPPGTFRTLARMQSALPPTREFGFLAARGRCSFGSPDLASRASPGRSLLGVRRPELGETDPPPKRKLQQFLSVLPPLRTPGSVLPLSSPTTSARRVWPAS